MTNTTTPTVSRPSFHLSNEIFFFVVLFGLLPAVKQLLLFAFVGFPMSLEGTGDESDVFIMKLLFFPPLALLPFSIFYCGYMRNWNKLLGILPPLTALILFGLIAMSWIDVQKETAALILFLAYKIAFLYFIVKHRLRSPAFLAAVLLVLLLIGFQEFILFVTYSVLFRFIYLAWKQNVDIFKKTGWLGTLKLVLRTFFYWWPLLIFIIPGAIISEKYYKASIDALYNHTFVSSSNEEKKYELEQFEKDLKMSFEGAIKANTKKVSEAGELFKDVVKEKQENIPGAATKKMGEVVPKDLASISSNFKEEECGFLDIPCGIKNMVKKELNKAYAKRRKEALDRFHNKTKEIVDKAGNNTNQLTTDLSRAIYKETDRMNKGTMKLISATFRSILILNLFLDILFGFLILKSFMYVFARVAFTDDTDNYVTFMEEGSQMLQGRIRKCGNHYTIKKGNSPHFFISRAFEPSGRAPRITFPQWTKAILARLGTRNYAMNKIVMDERASDVDFKAVGSHEFVEWNLKEGEQVIFHFSNFVGMSEGIRLSALLSLRLTSLLMGRLIFTTAIGPGKLILQTQGEPISSPDVKANSSVATSRIVAWHKNTRFHVESELNILDVFMSGIYLKKKAEDKVLIDADIKGQAKTGIVRFIKHFLLPI